MQRQSERCCCKIVAPATSGSPQIQIRYDGGAPHHGVDLIGIDEDAIARETIYVGEPFAAPEWRAQWRVAP